MDRNFMKLCAFLVVLTVILGAVGSSPNNDTALDENRHARVSGRIVKLYPGYKTEPVKCLEEGFQADPVDCSIFYRCIKAKSGKYSVLRFQCGPGTVYDPETEVCNHPHSTKRTGCSSRPFQIVPAPISKDNENDIDSSSHELPSPIKTLEPNVYQTSAWYRPNQGVPSTLEYQSVTSSGYGPFTPADGIHKPIEVNNIGDLSTTKASVVSTSENSKVTITQTNGQSHKTVDSNTNECNHDGFMGDSGDCRKFYRCVNNQRGGFTRYEFACSETTIWDDEKQSCNHPWAVRHTRCMQDVPYDFHRTDISAEDSTSRNTKTFSSTQAYGDRISYDEAKPSNLNVPSNSYLTENEQVTPTIQHRQTQPTSHYLHPIIQTQKELHVQSSTYVFSTEDPSYITRNPSNKAIDTKCTQSGFMGDPNDCRKFYRCVQNGKNSYIKHEFLCGEGTAWDERAESCNHAWMVKECGGKSIHDVTTTRNNYIDKKHTTTESISEGSGYNFGGIQSREPNALPVTSVPLNVPNKDENSEICNSAGYNGSKTDCRKFYSCIENDYGGFTKLEYVCDEGTVWDSNIEACNHIGVVKNCKVHSDSATKHSTPSTESTITTVSFIQSTIQSRNYTIYNEVQKTDNQCHEKGFMADRSDCRKFFRCVENGNNGFIRYEYSCGDGTAWDAKINACNHLRAVPACGNDNYNEATPIRQPPPESDENVNSYVTQTNEIKSTLGSDSTTQITTKLTTENNKLSVCSKSGFIGDGSDCKKFYRCVSNGDGSYTIHEFSCGEGTVWDPEIEACNHASSVKRCGGTLETQNGAIMKPPTTMAPLNDELDNGYAQNIDEKESPVDNNLQSEKPPVSDNSQECNQVGFMADRSDCRKFHRCVENGNGGYNKYEFSCGDGTAWDQSKEACDHISSVKGCSSTSEVSSSTITSIQSGHPVHSTSYPQYDDVTTVQPTQQKDDCVAEGFYGNPSDCKKFYRCVSNPPEGFIKYEFSCGEGTVWDQSIQACNHEHSDGVNCTVKENTSVSQHKPSETVDKPANSQETSLNEISTTEKDMNLPPNSNNSCTSEGFYPNLEDCKKFIRCVDNGDGNYVKYDFTCGEGTIWVQDIQACDHDNDNSTCTNKISTSTEAYPLTTQSTQMVTSSTIQSTIATTNTNPTENSVAVISSTDKCDAEGYFGDSNDCQRFYRCVADDNGSFIKYDYTCGEGTAWDVDRQACDHINNVKRCTNMQGSQTTTSETQVPQTTENIKTTIPPTTTVVQPQATESVKPTNTAQPQTTEQIKTTTVSTTITTQPQTTENVKTTIQSSATPTVTSTQEPSNTDDCNNEGYFGNKENCQKFYRCVNNGNGGYTKYDYICGEGTMWDQDILACNHPRDVKNPSCKQDSQTSPSGVSTESSIQSSESTSSQSTPTSTTTKQTASSTESSSQGSSNCSGNENVKNESITCTKAGYYPNPSDCKKFYRCVDWDGNGERFSVFHFECGEGTIWDPALDTCNYEDSVYPPRNCKGSQGQNDSTTTSAVTSEENTTSMTSETTTQTTQTASTDSTTQQITSTESTTQQISTTESTTQQITSTESTTQQTTSTVSSTPESTSTETTTQQISSTEPTTQQTSSTESTTQQITSTEPTTQQTTSTVSTAESTSTEPTTQQTSSTESTTQQITTQSTTQQLTDSTTQSATTNEPTTQQTTPTTQTSTTEQTSQASTTTEQPTSEKSTTEPTSEQTTETNQSTTGLSTTEETTQQSTESSTESQTSSTENGMNTTESTQETNKCPDTENDQYLYACPTSFKRHPKYCNLFYQCLEDNDSHELKIAVFNCPNGTIYDESRIQCVEESNAQTKCDGDIAQKRRFKRLNVDSKETIMATKDTYRCTRVGHFPFERNEECSPALLRCEISQSGKLRGFVYRCPDNYVYWSISRKCEPVSKMAHCKNPTSQWANRPEIPMERKNIAY